MRQRTRSLVVAAYILLCILLGGSSQSAWPGLALQLIGIGLIAWAALHRAHAEQEQVRPIAIYVIMICGLLLVLIQLIPLPVGLWSTLPGRAEIVQGIQELGLPLRPAPISEAPYASTMTLFALIPAIAALVATERLPASPRAIALAIVTGMVLGVFVGAIQVAGGPESSAYLYSIHSAGAVGFFANQNHMATLLLVGIPMAAGLIVSTKSDRRKTSIATLGVGAALLVLILVGIGLTASRAAIILSVPVIVASATLFPKVARWRGIALAVAVLGLIGAVVIVATNPIGATTTDTMDQPSSRIEIWTTSEAAIRDNLAVGTGLGSFEKVYHRYEDPTRITHSFINHAHNDYLELVVELGAAGLLLIIAFLAWWLIAVVKIWTSTLSSPLARASTIATAAILAHSAVDFPIRTQAISAIFAACIAIMARTLSAAPAIKPGEMRPTRHVTIR